MPDRGWRNFGAQEAQLRPRPETSLICYETAMPKLLTAALLGLVCAGLLVAAPQNLDIYWIDADGGAATLIVSPSGESMLVDSGNRRPDDRDAKRIYAATQQAGLKKIDFLLTTHFHSDHIGAMPALAKLIPIGLYMDHGESVEIARPDVAAAYKAYVEQSAGKRRILKPGDHIPLKGVDVEVIISAGQPITKALKGGGAPNPACADYKPQGADADPDNDQSVGFVLQFGAFRFIDMGDLTWNYEPKLVCPANLIGTVDIYQTTHHGLERSNSPQFVWAIRPKVAVMNNGSRKGGPASVFDILRHSPGLEDIWQTHLALGTPKEVNTDEKMIANLEASPDDGNWLKASVDSHGKYTLTNPRNGFSKTYEAKR
jgi:competence protein ComEC